MTSSDVLATIAIVISLTSAGWAAYRSLRWDKPVVSVSGSHWISGASQLRRAGFSIEVFNTGNQTTQVIDAVWEIDRGDGDRILVEAVHGGGGIESLFQTPETASATPKFPFTLSQNERLAWEFDLSLDYLAAHGGVLRARPTVKYTSRRRIEEARGAWLSSEIALKAN